MTPTSERPDSALSRALPGLLFLLLVVAVYADPLFHRRNFAGRDLLVYNLPIEKAVHDSWSRGSIPVWMSEISGGRPLAANPNAGVFYPVRRLLFLLPFPVAMRLYPILHWALAGLGMLLLVRSLGGSRSAAWVGAVTYAFSGVAVSEVFYTNYQPGMTLLPWIIWAIASGFRSRALRIITLSILCSLFFLAGDVFTIGIAVAACGIWIFVERPRPERAREVGLLLLALLFGLLLAAPQIVATSLWVPETNRAILGMKLSESLSFSVSPLRLLELVIPFPFGPTWTLDNWAIWGRSVFQGKNMGFFTTLYAGALAVIALFATRKFRRPGVRFGQVFFLLGLVVSVLPSLIPARWGHLPSPIPLRYPEKFGVAVVLGLAILAGAAVDRWRGGHRPPRWSVVVLVILAVTAGTAALLPEQTGRLASRLVHSAPEPLSAEVAAEHLPPAVAEGALLWGATVLALHLIARPSRFAFAGAIVLLTAVPVAANRRIARTLPEEGIFSSGYFARFLQRADPRGRYRTLGEALYFPFSPLQAAEASAEPEQGDRGWTEYRPALAGRGTVFNVDFDAGDLARVEALRKISGVAAQSADPGPFFGNLALRWGIRFRDQPPLTGFRQVGGNSIESWDELPGALPDIRLARSWREAPDARSAVDAVATAGLGDLVVETGVRGRGTARPGSVEVLLKTPERLLVQTEAPDPTWLFVLRGFWSHRSVTLDGRPIDCFPAQLAFSAIPIPAGRHRIDWRERVPGIEVSRWGPVLFALGVALVVASDRRRKLPEPT